MTTYQSLCPTDLITVLMTLGRNAPHVALLRHDRDTPTFEESHHSLQKSLRHWAEQRTGCPIGHMEQLYTFSTFPSTRLDREPPEKQPPEHPQNEGPGHPPLKTPGTISQPSGIQAPSTQALVPHIHITYLALSHAHPPSCDGALYRHFPWEDRRSETGNRQLVHFISEISQWAAGHEERSTRIAAAFGLHGLPWDDTRVLERYELLWESGLVPRNMSMAAQPGHQYQTAAHQEADHRRQPGDEDDRRLLATALSRLRARIRYSPAVFDLLPTSFTLFQLQQAMETLSGRFMHKPNFRRLVLHQKLVEETGEHEHATAGRPARLYRFCPAAMASCYLGAAFLPLEPLLPEDEASA